MTAGQNHWACCVPVTLCLKDVVVASGRLSAMSFSTYQRVLIWHTLRSKSRSRTKTGAAPVYLCEEAKGTVKVRISWPHQRKKWRTVSFTCPYVRSHQFNYVNCRSGVSNLFWSAVPSPGCHGDVVTVHIYSCAFLSLCCYETEHSLDLKRELIKQLIMFWRSKVKIHVTSQINTLGPKCHKIHLLVHRHTF